jgi:hypothetical protein
MQTTRLTYLCLILCLSGCGGGAITVPAIPFPASSAAISSDTAGVQTTIRGQLIPGGQVDVLYNLTYPIPTRHIVTTTPDQNLSLFASGFDNYLGVSHVEIDYQSRTCYSDGNGGNFNKGVLTSADAPTTSPPSYPIALYLASNINFQTAIGNFDELDYGFTVSATNAYGNQAYSQTLYYQVGVKKALTTHGCLGPPIQ